MSLRWSLLVTFFLVAVLGTISAQKTTEPSLASDPDVRLAQLKVAMAQAELDKLRQQVRQVYLGAQQQLQLLRLKREQLLARRLKLEEKDTKGRQEVERALEQLDLNEQTTRAAVERTSAAFLESQQPEKAKAVPPTPQKTLPLSADLKRIRI
jgi:TolA-binding protein